jgi:hypothetical protein
MRRSTLDNRLSDLAKSSSRNHWLRHGQGQIPDARSPEKQRGTVEKRGEAIALMKCMQNPTAKKRTWNRPETVHPAQGGRCQVRKSLYSFASAWRYDVNRKKLADYSVLNIPEVF